MPENKLYNTDENKDYIPKAVLSGVDYLMDIDFDHSITEMKGLIKACDMEVIGTMTQSLNHPDSATYIGSGKVYELKDYIDDNHADYCIFEGDLSPSQMKNLQKILGVPVWDRTNLILEIFSRRAKTKEAKLQVETAYLQFLLPRLTGMWQHLGRQGGGGGSRANKGVGETQLELDRRQINHRLAELSKELEEVSRTRKVQRDGRDKGEYPKVALVGYTNAGKSSLMNRLLQMSGTDSEKQVFEKNMLFATLDTSIRKISCTEKREFLLSDTVGFIENLPHGLIKAFRSTLEEVKYADLLLIVLDASDPYYKEHKKVTEDTLKELEANDIPIIYVMNKSDLIDDSDKKIGTVAENRVYISASTGEGINDLLEMIYACIFKGSKTVNALLPYSAGDFLNRLHKYATIISEEYTGDGVLISVDCPSRLLNEIEKFEVKNS